MQQTALKYDSDIPATIYRLLAGISVSRNELKQLLSLSDTQEIELLFSAAHIAASKQLIKVQPYSQRSRRDF